MDLNLCSPYILEKKNVAGCHGTQPTINDFFSQLLEQGDFVH